MSVAAIILAAGESRRMGRAKALLPFRSGTFLTVLAELMRPYCSPVIVVVGFDASSLIRAVPSSCMPVLNPDYKLGMLTSLQAGLRSLDASVPRVLFTPVDHPAVLPETVRRLAADNAALTIPRYLGRGGHPAVLSREIANEVLAEPASSRISDVFRRHEASIRYIDVDDPGIRDDIDDPSLYAGLLAREANRA